MAKTEIKRVEPPQSPIIRIGELVQQSDGKIDTAGMEKLLEMHFRHEADEARKVFASDFAAVQSNIAAVVKDKVNPQTKSKYAGLDGVIEMSKPVYTKQGFSIIYYEGKAESAEDVRVCADVLHRAGHKETYHLDVPLGGVGIQGKKNMTAIHAKATSLTYGRRYLLCMIWNIPTADDDGNGPGKKTPEIKPPNDHEQKVILAICAAILPPEGKRVDPKKVGAICYEQKQTYLQEIAGAPHAAKWFMDNDRTEIYIPENRSQFEIDQDLPGDEDSVPDEQPAAQYQCKKCGLEFDTPKEAAECRH